LFEISGKFEASRDAVMEIYQLVSVKIRNYEIDNLNAWLLQRSKKSLFAGNPQGKTNNLLILMIPVWKLTVFLLILMKRELRKKLQRWNIA
jgi:hypothetical protein